MSAIPYFKHSRVWYYSIFNYIFIFYIAVVTHSANTPAHVIFEKPLIKEAQPIKSPQKVIVWPSNHSMSTANNITYLVRQPVPTPVSVIRPSVMGQNTSLITNVLKPVMATGKY